MYNIEYGTIWDSIILDMTVSFSPNLTIYFVGTHTVESHVLQKHFNLRKSQIMMNCVLKES